MFSLEPGRSLRRCSKLRGLEQSGRRVAGLILVSIYRNSNHGGDTLKEGNFSPAILPVPVPDSSLLNVKEKTKKEGKGRTVLPVVFLYPSTFPPPGVARRDPGRPFV